MSKGYYFPLSDSCQIVDLAIMYEMWLGKMDDGSFVEVGAFDGVNWSNTYGLAKRGWRGLLFEPQVDLYHQCLKNYDSLNAEIECTCIGDYDGSTNLYLGGSISTTVPEMVDVYNSLDWSKTCGLDHNRFVVSQMHTLDTMFKKHQWPEYFELLVIDVEGAEMSVLRGLSLDRYHPRMMIMEAHEDYPDIRLSHKAEKILAYLEPYGYEKVYHDAINSIYLNREYDGRK